jgi:hypothetical protein
VRPAVRPVASCIRDSCPGIIAEVFPGEVGVDTHMKSGWVWPILLAIGLWARCIKRVRDAESEVKA